MNQYINKLNQPLAALLLAAFFAYSILSAIIGSPIFGSDEYAYFISGMYLERLEDLHQLDPGLQRISNLLYFKLINAWAFLFGHGFSSSFRTLHIGMFIAAAAIVHKTFKQIIDKSGAIWSVLAFLLLPNSIYIYAVMPETDLMLLAACLGYLLIVIFPIRQNLAVALAGFLLSAALLFKPHATALLAAAIFTVSCAPILGIVEGGRVAAIRLVFILLGTFYISLVILWRLSGQEWTFDPSLALGLNFYGQYLQSSPSQSLVSISTKLLMALHYAVAHLVVIALIFAPVLVWAVLRFVSMVKSRPATGESLSPDLSVATLFVLAMLIMHIAMIAWFTAGAASISETEAMRLHGRYLGPVIIFFPVLYFHAIKNLDVKSEKLVKVVVFFSLAACLLYLFRVFKIYPWDYPLLFAFYDANNNYGWGYKGAYSFGFLLLISLLAIWVIVTLKGAILKKVLFSQIFIILIAGCLQTYNWAINHTRVNSPLVEYAGAINAMLGRGEFGKGVLVSSERYGRTSYILFGLGNSPRVLIKNLGGAVSQDDIGDAGWVLFDGEYKAEFDYPDSILFGFLRFFPIKTNFLIERRDLPEIKVGNPVSISLSAGRYASSQLKGFNPQEEWGAWTDKENPEILLPVVLYGIVKLKLDGWTLSENLKYPLVVRVGDSLCKFQLSDVRKEYECTLNIRRPSDRIRLESPIYRPVDSHRNMGVAINIITTELLRQE